jgi:hypothetical protein
LIEEEDGIIASHGRVFAAHLLGLDEVPCIVLAHLTTTPAGGESGRREGGSGQTKAGTGLVKPNSRIEAAICATCWSLCVRAFLA